MNHDEKLKSFLKEHDQNDYSSPSAEFKSIDEKIKRKKYPINFFLLPAGMVAVFVLIFNLVSFQSSQQVFSDEEIGSFISQQMEYNAMEANIDASSYYMELIEE